MSFKDEGLMKIGLLIIGNEILEGKITDANTRQLSQFLRTQHLELLMALTVRDEEESIHNSLQILFHACDVIVTSGGLGPTKDDLTKEAIATFLGRKILYSDQSYDIALKNYLRFHRPFAGKEHGYCYLPEGFTALENSTGFAPGLFTEHQGKYLISGPGVPWEFKSLLHDHFVNYIKNRFPQTQQVIESFTVKTKRVPEEKIFQEVDITLWDKLSHFGTVSSLPSTMGVDIGIKVIAANLTELEEKKKNLRHIFTLSPIASSIWQFGTLPLEDYIVQLANQKKITFSFAESCTGGLCAHRITNIAGSSQTFMGSIVSYAESAKENLLNVSGETIQQFGLVSEEVAREMSEGAAEKFKTHIAISITGLAGPGGGSPEKPVGTACFGVTTGGKTQSFTLHLPGDREQLKLRFSQAALFYLLEELEKSS